jgi:hypothetical protein
MQRLLRDRQRAYSPLRPCAGSCDILANSHLPQSSCSFRRTASQVRFLLSSQSGERPARVHGMDNAYYKGAAALHICSYAAILSAPASGFIRTKLVWDRATKSLNDCPNIHAVVRSTKINRS